MCFSHVLWREASGPQSKVASDSLSQRVRVQRGDEEVVPSINKAKGKRRGTNTSTAHTNAHTHTHTQDTRTCAHTHTHTDNAELVCFSRALIGITSFCVRVFPHRAISEFPFSHFAVFCLSTLEGQLRGCQQSTFWQQPMSSKRQRRVFTSPLI